MMLSCFRLTALGVLVIAAASRMPLAFAHRRKKMTKVHKVQNSKARAVKGQKGPKRSSSGCSKAVGELSFDACDLFATELREASMSMPSSPSPNGRGPTAPTANSAPSNSHSPNTPTDSTPSPALSPSSHTTAPVTAPVAVSQPSSTESPSVLFETCRATNGVFGVLEGRLQVISYGYELETVPVSRQELEMEVLPALEHAITQFLLPILDEEECGSRRLVVDAPRHRRLAFVGMSARPDDVIVDGLNCSTVEDVNNGCNVVLGELSLYFEDERRHLDENEELVRGALRGGMEDNEFNSAHEDIVDVRYVDIGDIDDGTENGIEDSPSVQSQGVVVGWVVAAAAATTLLIGLVAYQRRRRQRQQEQNKGENEDPQDIAVPPADTKSLLSTDADENKDMESMVMTAHE